MKPIFEKLFKLGLDRRFGYKVATPETDLCIFRHYQNGLWQNLSMNPPQFYLESEVITILEHSSKLGTFKVFSCCCMKCADGGIGIAAMRDFENKYGERITSSFWPECAAAEHARFEA